MQKYIGGVMLEQVKEAVKLWGQVEDTTPRLLNKTAIRKVVADEIQISDQAIDFFDFVVYVLLKFIIRQSRIRSIKRLSAKNIRDILAEDMDIHLVVGSITYQEIKGYDIDEIVTKVYDRIIENTVKQPTVKIVKEKKESLNFDDIEFPDDMDGEEDGKE